MTNWQSPTQDHLWHKITHGPELTSAGITSIFKPSAKQEELNTQAQYMFELTANSGFLLIHLLQDGVYRFASHSHWASVWTIDGLPCNVTPPNLDFARMSRQIDHLEARLYSKGAAEDAWLVDYLFAKKKSELCQEIMAEFVYTNVNSPAVNG